MFFELGFTGSALGLMMFLKMSQYTHHTLV